MLPTIIIGALALAILWPFIRLGYELIKLAGSLVLLVASCAIGAVALIGQGAFHLISACRRHAGTKKDDTVPLQSVLDWARPQTLPVVVIPGGEHFFHGLLPLLKQIVVDAWRH